jgi:hypothetical protein
MQQEHVYPILCNKHGGLAPFPSMRYTPPVRADTLGGSADGLVVLLIACPVLYSRQKHGADHSNNLKGQSHEQILRAQGRGA